MDGGATRVESEGEGLMETEATDTRPKILAKSNPDKAAAITALLAFDLWDAMPIYERQAFCERGEVLDTPCGRQLLTIIKRSMGRD